MRILRESPYHDDYDPSKNYTQILARPGFVAQAREFTQMGTMTRDFIGRLGDAIFKDGNIINGVQISISEDKRQVKLSTGEIYLQGLVRRVLEPVTLQITGIGPEVVGVKLKSEIITESEDQTLRDPAQSYENYNREGAHRLKESLVWSINDQDSTVIFNLMDGTLVKAPVQDSADWFNDILARRTFDESGNYKVSGLQLQERHESTSDKVIISLTEGKAYIQGYEVIKPSVSTISLDYSRSTRLVKGEPKTYTSSSTLYKLNNYPFAELSSVRAKVEYTQTVIRGSDQGGTDYLSMTPVESIRRIHQSSTGTTYQEGRDFQLIDNGISWSLSGQEPSGGSEYSVTYYYMKDMKIGTDVQFSESESTPGQFIKLLSGDRPVNNSQFYIDYQFYLARTDLICLDKDGNIVVLQGVPDIPRLVQSPINQDPYLLVIGSVTLLPNTDKVIINNVFTNRLTQNELYSMMRRIQDIEYNQAVTDLDKEAMDNEQATNLKGILTDGFVGFTKSDISSSEFKCSLNINDKYMTLPFEQTIHPLEISTDSVSTVMGKFGDRLITSKFTNHLELEQSTATETMKVNPYAAYDIMSVVSINPKVDNWVDTDTVVINKRVTNTNTVYKTNTIDGGARDVWDHVNTGLKRAQELGGSWRDYEGEVISSVTHSSSSTSTSTIDGGSSTTTSSEVILDEMLTYMRPIKINFSGSNFSGGDLVEVYFNNKKVQPTALSGYTTRDSKLVVKSDGTVKGYFTIPKNTPSGVVNVELRGSRSSAETTFRSEGRKKVMKNTVLTTDYKTKVVNTSITNTRVITKRYDPVAQSFELSNDSFINSVGVYFKVKDSTKPVILQVRPIDNGFPESTILAESILTPDRVKVSENASEETIFELDQPVYCRVGVQYAICIITDSDLYEVFIAKVGSRKLQSGEYVTSQPYTQGVLFSSSNGATWTTHQDSDLKFNIYRPKFIQSGNILYKEVALKGHTRFSIAIDYLDYNNSGVKWYYKTSDSASAPWTPVLPYVDIDLNPTTDKKLYLKSIINFKGNVAPLVAKDTLNLVLNKDVSPGAYVSRTVFMSEKYTKVKIIADMHLPSGCNYELYINAESDHPNNWIRIPNSPTSTVQLNRNKGEEVSRYTWDYNLSTAGGSVASGSKSYRVKLKLTSTNLQLRPKVMKLVNILKY